MANKNRSDRYRTQEIAKIHVAKRDLGLTDQAYRAILVGAAGVESAADLDWQGRAAVLGRMEELGWKPAPARKASRSGRPARKLASDSLSKKIRALWLDLHQLGAVRDPSEAALAGYVMRMTGVAALQWLSPSEASTVIEALKKWRMRVAP